MDTQSVSTLATAPQSAPDQVQGTLFGSGKERIVILVEKGSFSSLEQELSQQCALDPPSNSLSDRSMLVLRVPQVTRANAAVLVDALSSQLQTHKIRSAVFVGLGDASALTQSFTLSSAKIVRQLILIDPVFRPHQNAVLRIVASLEQYLPLGLPFRARSDELDLLPISHRVRCPTVISVSPHAATDAIVQARTIAARMPNALFYLPDHPGGSSSAHEAAMLEQIDTAAELLKNIPAKMPQRRR